MSRLTKYRAWRRQMLQILSMGPTGSMQDSVRDKILKIETADELDNLISECKKYNWAETEALELFIVLSGAMRQLESDLKQQLH